ncbi:MAG: hypothetical protein KAJ14_02915, partial [Candidatus Omnitrophica bacterium]|nr:hypothetical protein [Candidatus Omnitrophota bacterium]
MNLTTFLMEKYIMIKISSSKKLSIKIISFIIIQAFMLLQFSVSYAGNSVHPKDEVKRSTLAAQLNINELIFQTTFNQLSLGVAQRIEQTKPNSIPDAQISIPKQKMSNITKNLSSLLRQAVRKIKHSLLNEETVKRIVLGTTFTLSFLYGFTWIAKLGLIVAVTISQAALIILIPAIIMVPLGLKVMKTMSKRGIGYLPTWSFAASSAAFMMFSPIVQQ